jgi:hypothetical protein
VRTYAEGQVGWIDRKNLILRLMLRAVGDSVINYADIGGKLYSSTVLYHIIYYPLHIETQSPQQKLKQATKER